MTGTDGQEERRHLLRELVTTKGFVRTSDLAAEFAVSVMTVHRDLDALQAQGWLRKVRGGASCLPSTQFHGSVGERMTTMTPHGEAGPGQRPQGVPRAGHGLGRSRSSPCG
ncbi:DeoR family transcriptional regulator [Streptomyces iranensis]|uniref:DeoR family transcriptional regulator n=1 Tax=Streptomyces iranensis TaxID=576784 RepID=UPI0039B76ABE